MISFSPDSCESRITPGSEQDSHNVYIIEEIRNIIEYPIHYNNYRRNIFTPFTPDSPNLLNGFQYMDYSLSQHQTRVHQS